jgi:hypothetical protein
MSVQQGRIGGPLLADNLLRNGANLAFENKVLYLDVVNKRIGFNNAAPVNDLYVPTAIDSVNLIVDNTTDIGNWVVSGSTIQQVITSITISPSNINGNASISTPGLSTSSLYISNNTLTATVSNNNINITPNGTGNINFANDNGNVQVTANDNLHATGNITFDGNITFGTNSSERITFIAEVNSDLLPTVTPNTLISPAQNIVSQNSPLFIGIDDDTLLYVSNKNALVTPQAQPYITQAGFPFATQSGATMFSTPPPPYIGTSYLWDLGSNALQWNNTYTVSLPAVSSTSSTISATTANFGNLVFTGNTISDIFNDIGISTTGTGAVNFNGNYYFKTPNTLTFPNSTSLSSTGSGYFKVAGSGGLVIPVGTNSNRPSNPVEGTVRYDTALAYVEVYSASQGWIPAYGQNANATVQNVEDSSTLYSIVFGY